MEEYLSFKNQILNMSGRNQREPYFPRDSQPLRPRPVDYANKLNNISPQIQMNANRSKTAEKIRGQNGYIDPSVQYRSNPRTPSNNYYAVENRLNTSVDYRSNGGRRSSETNANQQKAKFLFFALQKCMRKAMWKTFLSKIEQCKTANSMSYHVPQSLSKTLPLDEIPGINDSRSINYSDIRHPNASYIDHHYTPSTDVQKTLIHPRNSIKPIHPQAYQHSNQKAKNASFSAILPELQNEWSPDINNEIFFPRSNGTNPNSQCHVDPNQLNIQGYASNSSWGHTKYLDAYSSQPNTKAPLAKNTSQRSSFYNPRDYQSNPVTVTAGSYILSNNSKDKNYELFSLLLKKTLQGFQKKSKADCFGELKEFYKRAIENEKAKVNITREDGSLEPITLEESNLLEYSNRTLLSPNNAVFPIHPSARQQKLNEIMNREKKLKTQLLAMTLQKTFSLRKKESFTKISVFDKNDKLHIKNGGRILLLAMFLQKKIDQQMHYSFDSIKSHSQEIENYRSQQVQKGLLLQLLLRKSAASRKTQAMNRWREFVSRARQAAYEKKDVLLSKNLNSMVNKYKDITNSYEKINKRYTEFCQRPRKSTSGNEDSFSKSFTQDPLDKENKGQAFNTPSKTGSIRKVSSMSWAKQKSVEGLAEMISRRLLKDAFNQIKRRPFFINIQGLREIEKSNKLQPKTTNGNTSLDLKISKSLLETFQQSAKKQPPQSETKSHQNTNSDLLSAINFLKGL